MSVLYDARGNEILADILQGNVVTDVRAKSVNLSALNAETITQLNGQATLSVDIRGTFVATISFRATIDGTNYFAVPAINVLTGVQATAVTAAGTFYIGCTSYLAVSVIVTAYTSGTAVVSTRGSTAAAILIIKKPPLVAVTVTGAANTAATLTIPAPGVGLYHYIYSLEISRQATAALAGTAVLTVTTTNLPGTLSWVVGNAMAAGGQSSDVSRDFPSPLKSTAANTASTIVMPAPGAAVQWKATAYYHVGA